MSEYTDEMAAVEQLNEWLEARGALKSASRVAGGWITGVSVEYANAHLLFEGAALFGLAIRPSGRYTCHLGEHAVAGASLTVPTRHILLAVAECAERRYPWNEQARTLTESAISFDARHNLIALAAHGVVFGGAPTSTAVTDTIATLLGDALSSGPGLDIGFEALLRASAKAIAHDPSMVATARALHADQDRRLAVPVRGRGRVTARHAD